MKTKFRKLVTQERLKECDDVIKALDEVIQEAIDASVSKMRNPENFKLDDWSNYVALELGIQKGLMKVKETIGGPHYVR